MVEKGLFPNEPVASKLKAGFVEARLHTDNFAIPKEKLDEIKRAQMDLVGHVALPVYVVLDPNTGKALGKFEGRPRSAEVFIEFLENGKGN